MANHKTMRQRQMTMNDDYYVTWYPFFLNRLRAAIKGGFAGLPFLLCIFLSPFAP